MAIVLVQGGLASAHQSPVGCVSTGVSLTLTTYRSDAATPVGSGTVTDGENVVYRATIAVPTGACDFEGGQITIDPPGPAGPTDVTPFGGVGCIGTSGGSCVPSKQSQNLTYFVQHGDEFNSGSSRRIRADAAYTNGTAHDSDGDTEGLSATASKTNTVAHPDLHVAKTPDGGSIDAGETATFTITATNDGAAAANDVKIDDDLPGGVTWSTSTAGCTITGTSPQHLHCDVPSPMAVGGSFTATVTAPTTEANAGTLSNTACVTSTSEEMHGTTTGETDNCDSGDITVNAPNLSITKTPDATPVSAGTDIGFTISVTNNGPGTSTNTTLSDPLPAGTDISWSISPAVAGCSITGSPPSQTLNCSFGDLASGASAPDVHVTSTTGDNSAGTYENTATADADNSPPVNASATIVVQAPSLAITKVADAASVSTTEDIGFTVTVSNGGPGTATSVTLNDPLPGGTGIDWSISPAYPGPGTCSISGTAPTQTLTCAFGDLASGSSVSVHVTSATTSDSEGTYDNTATADSSNGPEVTASASVVVVKPILEITKTADASPVSAGEDIGYTITVTNSGSGTAFAATLTDALPAGTDVDWSISPAYAGPGTCSISGSPPSETLSCAFGNLASGAGATIHVTSTTTFDSAGTYDNTASAQANNSPEVEASAQIIVLAPGLAITKVADDPSVSTTEDIGFTITVSNGGPGTAAMVTLNDPLPDGAGVIWSITPAYAGPGSCMIAGAPPAQVLTCAFGNMAPLDSISVHVQSATTAASAGTYENTATASATNAPSVSATDTIVVLAPALEITKVADDTTVSTTDDIGFTINVSNGGTGIAFGATLNDPLPGGNGVSWTISPAYAGPGTCAISGSPPTQTLSCAFGDMAPGDAASIHVTSNTTSDSAGTYANTATAEATNNAPVSASATIVVNAPDLAVTKTADDAVISEGEDMGYTITVTNNGPGTAYNATLNDKLPGHNAFNWTIDPAYAGPGTCSITGSAPTQTLSCSFGDLASGASATVHVKTATTFNCGGDYENIATADADNDDAVSSEPVTVHIDHPGMEFDVSADGGTVYAGTPIGFTYTVVNNGPGTIFDATLSAPLPAGSGVDWSLAPAAAGCTVGGAVGNEALACSFGDLADGDTRTVHVASATTSASVGTYTTVGKAKAWNSPVLTDSATETVICVPLSGGATHGKAYGASLGVGDVKVIDDLNKQESVATVADGMHSADGVELLETVPGVVSVTFIRDESNSEVTATSAASTAKATTAAVDLLDGMITADALIGVSRSAATATSASFNSTGSKIVNLRINGGDVIDVANPNTKILVPGDGGDVIASLVLYEESGTTSVGSHQTASHSVNMLHLTLLKPYAGFPAGIELIIGHASTDASLAAEGVCGS